VSSPADAQQPSVWRRDRARTPGRARVLTGPALEPTRGGGPVEHRAANRGTTPALREVPTRIEQHVRERIPHLARGTQHAQVVATSEHGPPRCKGAIDRACEAGGQRLHSAPKGLSSGGLDALGEGALQLSDDMLPSQVGETFPDLQGDVTREAAMKSWGGRRPGAGRKPGALRWAHQPHDRGPSVARWPLAPSSSTPKEPLSPWTIPYRCQ